MPHSITRIALFLVALAASCACFSAAQTPVPLPITGNLGQISGNPQAYAGVSIQLQNCPGPVSVTGYMGIVATAYQIQANSAGVVNSTIWPNDLITCNGTTGASQYALRFIVNGIPSGTAQCYQVVSTQGVWNLNGQQQPIACAQTPPDPQDATYRNLTVNGFLQGNNGDMTGTWTVYGLIYAIGGIQLSTLPTPCSGSNFMTGLSTSLQPVCSALPAAPPSLTSFNGRTTPAAVPTANDYSYGMVSGTPVFGATPAAPSGFSNVNFQASGASNSAYIPASGVPVGACNQPASITFAADGRATGCTAGTSPAARIIAVKTLTSCALSGADPDGGWSCSGSISWPSTLPDALYHTSCTLTYPNPYGSGTYGYSAANPTAFELNPGTTTTNSQGYVLGAHQSGSNGATFPMFCMAIE